MNWKDPKKQLPEKDQEVLVAFKETEDRDGDAFEAVFDGKKFVYKQLTDWYDDGFNGEFETVEPDAWMERPKFQGVFSE